VTQERYGQSSSDDATKSSVGFIPLERHHRWKPNQRII